MNLRESIFYFFFQPIEIISFLFLIIVTILKIFNKISEKNVIILIYLFLISNLLAGTVLSYFQYKIWLKHPISKYLLPPHQDISYFLTYSIFRFFRDFYFRLYGFLFTIFVIFIIRFLFKRDPFYEDEKLLILLFVLLFPLPFNSLFLLIGFIILLGEIFWLMITKKISTKERISLRWLWFYLAWLLVVLKFILYPTKFFLSNKP